MLNPISAEMATRGISALRIGILLGSTTSELEHKLQVNFSQKYKVPPFCFVEKCIKAILRIAPIKGTSLRGGSSAAHPASRQFHAFQYANRLPL